MSDQERIDWLEHEALTSATGVSFDWVPVVEGKRSGWRFIRFHFVAEPQSSLRDAIDNAMRSLTP